MTEKTQRKIDFPHIENIKQFVCNSVLLNDTVFNTPLPIKKKTRKAYCELRIAFIRQLKSLLYFLTPNAIDLFTSFTPYGLHPSHSGILVILK